MQQLFEFLQGLYLIFAARLSVIVVTSLIALEIYKTCVDSSN